MIRLFGLNLYGGGHTTTTAALVFLLLLLTPVPPHAAAQSGQPSPPLLYYNPGPPPKVDLKMAIVMVLLVTVFFVLGFLSVYTRQCAQNRFRGHSDLSLGLAGVGGAWTSRGLDPEIIETFPTFVYSTVKGLKLGKGSLECAVCLNEFEDNETLRLIPKCDHVFHPDCIDAWLVSHSTCPVCRANLFPKPGETHRINTLADILSPNSDSGQPEPVPNTEEPRPIPNRQVSIRIVGDDHRREEKSPEINMIDGTMNQSCPPRSRSTGFGPPRSRSTGWRFGGLFPRSHSTGHSLVRPGESHERFTLRLPEEVRNQLLNSTLNRTKSSGAALPRVGSARRGYRSVSVGIGRTKDNSYYERFEPDGRPDRWTFSVVPPFFSRTGSVRSSKGIGGDDVATRSNTAWSDSKEPPSDRFYRRRDDVGERSSDPLRLNDQV